MKSQPKNKIEIKPMGSYFEVDEDGFLKNPASLDKVQEKWRPVLDDVVVVYKKHFGDKLINVYVRGSVAKGEAVEGVSDLDSFAYVDLKDEEIEKSWRAEAKRELKEKHPFVESFEIYAEKFSENSGFFVSQSICLYGKEMQVRKRKPGREMFYHINDGQRYENADKWFREADPSLEEKIKNKCAWLMKNILRSGCEITMERSKRYTRDLYLRYKDFAEYYPEKEEIMREVLDLALNPVSDMEKILEVKNKITPFLIEEAKKVL
jgi:predicted nucleotidyltransferase